MSSNEERCSISQKINITEDVCMYRSFLVIKPSLSIRILLIGSPSAYDYYSHINWVCFLFIHANNAWIYQYYYYYSILSTSSFDPWRYYYPYEGIAAHLCMCAKKWWAFVACRLSSILPIFWAATPAILIYGPSRSHIWSCNDVFWCVCMQVRATHRLYYRLIVLQHWLNVTYTDTVACRIHT